MASPTINTLTSYSGSDMVATFANKAIGNLQQISWAVQRDKSPIFTMGSADARSFSRGKRGIAGSMAFAVFDNDALIEALQSVWDQIAPSAMFTAAANRLHANSEDFSNALDMLKWNKTVSDAALDNTDEEGSDDVNRAGYGFSYGSTNNGDYTNSIDAQSAKGSNSKPIIGEDGYVKGWDNEAADDVFVPAGFSPIRGENVVYLDTLPPFDITMTFGSEYGHTSFQKIYDVDLLNESSGISVDTTVMSQQVTWIARRLSPLIRGVYTRDESGLIRGTLPTTKATNRAN